MNTVSSSLKKAEEQMKKAAKALPLGKKLHEYTWEELQSIEKRRREILTHVEEPFWNILCHWDGTVFQLLMRDSLFWITITIYIAVRIQARLGGLPTFVADLGTGDIAVVRTV